MVSRTVTAIAIASMLTLQATPKLAHAENQMGYRLLSVQEASRLPRIAALLAWTSSGRSRSPTTA
jgi:hypothetical protein